MNPLLGISWSADSNQLIAVNDNSYIHVEVKRPECMQAHLSDALVFCLRKKGEEEMSVMFWDLHNSEKLFLDIKNIKKIASCEDYVVLCSMAQSGN